MRLIATLALGLLLASAAALADEAGHSSMAKRPSYTQPTEREMEQLAPASRGGMSVDLSDRDAREVKRLYRHLMRETAPEKLGSPP